MRILRIYKAGKRSWTSPRGLLEALKSDNIKVVKHHPDANVDYAIGHAIRMLHYNIKKVSVQAIVTVLWSCVPALFILWPPLFYAMSPEARGAIWIATAICFVIGWWSFFRAQLDLKLVRRGIRERWEVEDGPTMIAPGAAWR